VRALALRLWFMSLGARNPAQHLSARRVSARSSDTRRGLDPPNAASAEQAAKTLSTRQFAALRQFATTTSCARLFALRRDFAFARATAAQDFREGRSKSGA
jgi:hypothetical protein